MPAKVGKGQHVLDARWGRVEEERCWVIDKMKGHLSGLENLGQMTTG